MWVQEGAGFVVVVVVGVVVVVVVVVSSGGFLPEHCVKIRATAKITIRQRTTTMEILRILFMCTPFEFKKSFCDVFIHCKIL
jgi:hypothetical protein